MTLPNWVVLALTKEERLFLWTGVLALVIVAGALVVARVDKWRKRQMADGDETPAHLGSFRDLFERGELTRAEYDGVLRRIAAKAAAKGKPVSPPALVTPAEVPPPAAEGPPVPPPG